MRYPTRYSCPLLCTQRQRHGPPIPSRSGRSWTETYQTELVAENDLESGEAPAFEFPFRAVASANIGAAQQALLERTAAELAVERDLALELLR